MGLHGAAHAEEIRDENVYPRWGKLEGGACWLNQYYGKDGYADASVYLKNPVIILHKGKSTTLRVKLDKSSDTSGKWAFKRGGLTPGLITVSSGGVVKAKKSKIFSPAVSYQGAYAVVTYTHKYGDYWRYGLESSECVHEYRIPVIVPAKIKTLSFESTYPDAISKGDEYELYPTVNGKHRVEHFGPSYSYDLRFRWRTTNQSVALIKPTRGEGNYDQYNGGDVSAKVSVRARSAGIANVLLSSYDKKVKTCHTVMVTPKSTSAAERTGYEAQIRKDMAGNKTKFSKTLAWFATKMAEAQYEGVVQTRNEMWNAGFSVSADTSVSIKKQKKLLLGFNFGPRYVLASQKHKGTTYIVVSIRGTDTKKDWFANIYTASRKKDKIHPGFLAYGDAVYKSAKGKCLGTDGRTLAEIINQLKNKQEKKGNVRVLVMGHSLGGAAAQTFAYTLLSEGMPPECVQVYTLGAPAPFSSAKVLGETPVRPQNTLRWYNLVHNNDLATKVGYGAVLGFRAGNDVKYALSKSPDRAYLQGMTGKSLTWWHDPAVYRATLAYR